MTKLSDYIEDGPEIHVGKLIIREMKDGSIWIELPDGEGSNFPADIFQEHILEFYRENF